MSGIMFKASDELDKSRKGSNAFIVIIYSAKQCIDCEKAEWVVLSWFFSLLYLKM